MLHKFIVRRTLSWVIVMRYTQAGCKYPIRRRVTSEEWEINQAAFWCIHHMRDTSPTLFIHHHAVTLSKVNFLITAGKCMMFGITAGIW